MNETPTRVKGFFYYVFGSHGAPPADLRYAIPAGATATKMLTGGPDGAGGTILSNHDVTMPVDHLAIVWEKMPGLDYYLGIDPDLGAPGPDDLMREETIGGYPIDLAGSEWTIPLARVWPEGTRIPETMGYGPDGSFVTIPVARYAPLCRRAERIFDMVVAEYGLDDPGADSPDPGTIDGREAFDLAVEILAVNYRVGPAEVTRLGLIDTANLKFVIGYFVDLPSIFGEAAKRTEAKKKADEDSADQNNGSTPDGGPD